jgi:adenylate kinase
MSGNEINNPPLRRYCFTGVRGVGKSTIKNRIFSNVPEIHFVSGSDILQQMMGENYKQFEYLPETEKYRLRIELSDILYDIQQKTGKDLVVDSHLTVYNLKTQVIDTIFTEKDIAFYTDIILLDSYTEKIYDHRSRDGSKKRIVDEDIITRELDTERQEAYRVAEEYGMQLHIIEMGDEADENLINVLSSRISPIF